MEQRAASGDVAGLVLLLDDPDAAVRADAAEQLGELRASEAVSPLLDALRDTAPEVQVAAATALGEIGDGAAVRPLIRLLRDPGTIGVENAAAGALAALGDPRSVAPLLEAGQLTSIRPDAPPAVRDVVRQRRDRHRIEVGGHR